jgi:hypothetical protein
MVIFENQLRKYRAKKVGKPAGKQLVLYGNGKGINCTRRSFNIKEPGAYQDRKDTDKEIGT